MGVYVPPDKRPKEAAPSESTSTDLQKAAPSQTITIEKFRAESGNRAAFVEAYLEEFQRMGYCPVQVKNAEGGYSQCGVKLKDITQALAHHEIHLMFMASDHRVQLQAVKDIREIAFPTEFQGVRAALQADERAELLKNPEIMKRLTGGDD